MTGADAMLTTPATNHADPTAPTLNAYERILNGATRWSVWCSYCQVWHNHGPAEGHRWAHCQAEGSPYQETGYNLRFVGMWIERG